MKIIIAGSNGFIGRHLVSHFEGEGHEVIQLSRNPQSPRAYFWDPEKKEIDPTVLAGAEVVINLSGESILGRWNDKKMEEIRKSRLNSTQFLCDTLLKQLTLPKLYIGASAVGYYGDRPKEVLDESSPAGNGFLADVCREWEAIPQELAAKGVRTVFTRFGIVLGEGGALKQMEKAFRVGMGGTLGSGEQMMSWIAIDDVCKAYSFIIAHPEISGPINCVAPHPVSNAAFTQALGRTLHMPVILPVPKFVLSMAFGQAVEMLLASTEVHPRVLLEKGFKFQYPNVEEALKKYLQGVGSV